ncbi:MAG TPA: ABC transporter substrate-binding protein [Dehalococcoidia bacterium]|nr:ABC transporter substrate-binding protein [Dehalococcoidia bacterium]
MRSVSRRLFLIGGATLLAGCGASGGKGGGQAGSTSSPAGNNAAATPSGPPTKITAAYGAAEPAYLQFWIAKEAGIFLRHGLDVDLQVIPGAQVVPALISGQLQIGAAGPGETIGADIGGADLVMVATTSPSVPTFIYVPASIKTAADLKGKKAAITNPGSTFDVLMRQALPKMGLEPDKDVTLIATGSITNAATALLNGAVSAAPVNVGALSVKVEAAGFHSLYDTSNIQFALQVLVLQRSYLASHRDVAQRFVDAFVEAVARERADKAFTIEVIKKYIQVDDAPTLNAIYDAYSKDSVAPVYPFPKPEGFAIPLDEVIKRDEKAKGFDVTKSLDPSLVQSAFDRKVGK